MFVSGCTHYCKGCHNPETWSHSKGEPVTPEFIKSIIADLKDHTGFTLTGGDPLSPKNRDDSTELLKTIKQAYPDKDIWVWTGYTYDTVKDLPIMKYIDVLIDGPYQRNNPTLKPWRGSDNQELIYLCKKRN